MAKIVYILSICFALLLTHCTNELPISDLINNTVTVKMLGTYESNDAKGFVSALPKDDVITAGSGVTGITAWNSTSQIATYANSLTAADVKYYIDIAEIRMATGQGKSSSQSISDYWNQFAISRQLMCSDYGTADNRTLANCAESNGTQRLSDFFNGGFTYPAVDVKAGYFNHMGIYFRRFATFPSAFFYADGTYYNGSLTASQNSLTTIFDNRTIYGQDIEILLQNPHGATATTPMMFPLQRTDLALQITNDHEPYVLEVRVFLKNLMMVHIFQQTADLSNAGQIYVAPADWNVNHAFTDSLNYSRQGGAVLFSARTYQPSKVGSIQMTGSTVTSPDYFAVVAEGTSFSTPVTVLPLAATSGSNTTITNLQPGTYDVYHTCDAKYCSNNSAAGTCDQTAGTNKDGYPESAKLCQASVVVSKGTVTSVSAAACNACP